MATKLVRFLIAYTSAFLLFMSLVFVLAKDQSVDDHAILGMGLCLNLVWCLACGLLMLGFRSPMVRWVRGLPGYWQVKFVVGCTVLALVEEAVTTTLTNMAPLFGAKVGEAYITASANYIDVVTRHSVVVFVPMFVCWAWMLTRRRFTPVQVFLLFGASGSIAEAQFGHNPMHLIAGFWYFVYGLMVWLPACAVPEDRRVRDPRWWHFPLAIVLPGLFVAPVAFGMSFFHHPQIDFVGR